MMNLMIVEDEDQLLDNLAHNIPWHEHGIEVVAAAGNGLEAMQLFGATKPDIILLDIQMPEVDGITFAGHLSSRFPQVKIILLSGHDDFQYAQKAVEYNVVKYLLKPAGFDEIVGAVLEAKQMVKLERDRLYMQEQLQQKWEQHLPHLRDNFYLNWVHGQYARWEIERRGQDMMSQLPHVRYFAVAVVEIDPIDDKDSRFNKGDETLLRFSLNGMAKEYLGAITCHVFQDRDDATLVLFLEEGMREESDFAAEIHLYTSRLLELVKEYLKVTASAGISQVTSQLENVAQCYKQARRALQERIVYGHDLAIPFREGKNEAPGIALNLPAEKKLTNALDTGNAEKAIAGVEELLEENVAQAESLEEMQEHALYFSGLFIRAIHMKGWSVKEVVGEQYTYFLDTGLLETRDHMRRWLHHSIAAITSYVQKRSKSVSHETVEAMLQFVDDNLDQPINLHMVAQQFYVNSFYLSRLFKQETGQVFSQYVLEKKMKLAMERLHQGEKVTHTARSLGYKDVSYFTKVFRKYWGVTPGEVRGNV